MDILALLQCLRPTVTKTTLRQCSRIVLAMLVMTGRVMMLGLSRWAGTGGSSRTIQRFFATALPWATLLWVFFRHPVYRAAEVSLLVGDAVVATKAGKHPYGRDRFLASLYGQPVPGLACFPLARVSVQARRARRRRASRQQGQSGIAEGQSAMRTASAWASTRQQEHSQSRRDLHAGVVADDRRARRLA